MAHPDSGGCGEAGADAGAPLRGADASEAAVPERIRPASPAAKARILLQPLDTLSYYQSVLHVNARLDEMNARAEYWSHAPSGTSSLRRMKPRPASPGQPRPIELDRVGAQFVWRLENPAVEVPEFLRDNKHAWPNVVVYTNTFVCGGVVWLLIAAPLREGEPGRPACGGAGERSCEGQPEALLSLALSPAWALSDWSGDDEVHVAGSLTLPGERPGDKAAAFEHTFALEDSAAWLRHIDVAELEEMVAGRANLSLGLHLRTVMPSWGAGSTHAEAELHRLALRRSLMAKRATHLNLWEAFVNEVRFEFWLGSDDRVRAAYVLPGSKRKLDSASLAIRELLRERLRCHYGDDRHAEARLPDVLQLLYLSEPPTEEQLVAPDGMDLRPLLQECTGPNATLQREATLRRIVDEGYDPVADAEGEDVDYADVDGWTTADFIEAVARVCLLCACVWAAVLLGAVTQLRRAAMRAGRAVVGVEGGRRRPPAAAVRGTSAGGGGGLPRGAAARSAPAAPSATATAAAATSRRRGGGSARGQEDDARVRPARTLLRVAFFAPMALLKGIDYAARAVWAALGIAPRPRPPSPAVTRPAGAAATAAPMHRGSSVAAAAGTSGPAAQHGSGAAGATSTRSEQGQRGRKPAVAGGGRGRGAAGASSAPTGGMPPAAASSTAATAAPAAAADADANAPVASVPKRAGSGSGDGEQVPAPVTPAATQEPPPPSAEATAAAAAAATAATATASLEPAAACIAPASPGPGPAATAEDAWAAALGAAATDGGPSGGPQTSGGDDALCLVCLDGPREYGFLHGDSLHTGVCSECLGHMTARRVASGEPLRCPVCRCDVERTIAVFH